MSSAQGSTAQRSGFRQKDSCTSGLWTVRLPTSGPLLSSGEHRMGQEG